MTLIITFKHNDNRIFIYIILKDFSVLDTSEITINANIFTCKIKFTTQAVASHSSHPSQISGLNKSESLLTLQFHTTIFYICFLFHHLTFLAMAILQMLQRHPLLSLAHNHVLKHTHAHTHTQGCDIIFVNIKRFH